MEIMFKYKERELTLEPFDKDRELPIRIYDESHGETSMYLSEMDARELVKYITKQLEILNP